VTATPEARAATPEGIRQRGDRRRARGVSSGLREYLVDRILAGEIDRDDLESAKLDACSKFSSPKVPKNTEILDHAPTEARDDVIEVVQRKPVRTASGVSPVAIMTSPKLCPHGKCLYCPGGPASEFSSAQSYTGHEPAAAGASRTTTTRTGQVTLRLEQLRKIGHPVDKVESSS